MDSFDDEGNMKFILAEIQKIDTFYNVFKIEFAQSIYPIIRKFYPEFVQNDETDNLMMAYSVAILNSTESVIDKDRNYPLYRLEEELTTMRKIILKFDFSVVYGDFPEAIHAKAKELIVKHFDAIYDLSSVGFRLLEMNSRLYNHEFVSTIQSTLVHRV